MKDGVKFCWDTKSVVDDSRPTPMQTSMAGTWEMVKVLLRSRHNDAICRYATAILNTLPSHQDVDIMNHIQREQASVSSARRRWEKLVGTY